MNINYSTPLIFENGDETRIIEVLEASKLCWNECSKVRFGLKNNSITELHRAFYKDFRKSQPQIPAQVVICSQRAVLSSYKSAKSSKHKLSKAHHKKKLSLRLDCNSYSYKKDTFSIISLGKRVKCKFYIYPKLREYLDKYEFGDPLIYVRNNKIYISLSFKIPDKENKRTLALGVDLGCRINAATSEGKLFVDKKFNGRKRKLRFLKRELQSAKSKGSKSAYRHLRKLKDKETNINKNFSHHLANRLLETKADVIALENLKSIKVKKNKFKTQNRLSQIPLHQLKMFLTYKAPLKGKTVIEVCPNYSSQIDSQTGKRDGTRRGRRYYAKNGLIYDSDINAAINIAKRSNLPVSLGSQSIGTYGQATVNSPIVSLITSS